MILISNSLSLQISSDKVLVLEDGEVVEFGNPKRLIRDTDSQFFKLMKDF